MSHYADASTDELLDALKWDGRHSDVDLLDSPEQGSYWQDDDPRWYRMIHAGLLLIHFRNEDALSLILNDYRQCTIDSFNDWFENKLRLYGPSAVDPLIDLLRDEDAGIWGRIEAAGELSHIGWAHPETKETVLAALRDILPAVEDDPSAVPDDESEDPMFFWTDVAYELARHQDEASRDRVEALFDRDLIDPMIFADREEYRRLLRGQDNNWDKFEPASFDVVDLYDARYRNDQKEKEWRAAEELREKRREEANKGGHFDGSTFVRDPPKVGRNDPCPCGSGRKYKHRCG